MFTSSVKLSAERNASSPFESVQHGKVGVTEGRKQKGETNVIIFYLQLKNYDYNPISKIFKLQLYRGLFWKHLAQPPLSILFVRGGVQIGVYAGNTVQRRTQKKNPSFQHTNLQIFPLIYIPKMPLFIRLRVIK